VDNRVTPHGADVVLVAAFIGAGLMLALCHCGDAFMQGPDTQTVDDAGGLVTDAPTADDRVVTGKPHDGGSDSQDSDCTTVMHSNGVGEKWTDCVPIGTYNQAQATKACTAYTGDPSKCNAVNADGGMEGIADSTQTCTWWFAGLPGTVHAVNLADSGTIMNGSWD